MSHSAATTATMVARTTLPSPPPSCPLPSLPVAKNRKSLSPMPKDEGANKSLRQSGASILPIPAASRSVTPSSIPLPKPTKTHSTPSVPTLASTRGDTTPSGLPTPAKPLRKTISTGAFPQPPKGAPRVASLPPSPLSTSTSVSETNDSAQAQRRDSGKYHGAGSVRKPKGRSSGYGVRTRLSESAASGVGASPSLLNGSAENKFISSAAGARGSESLLNLPSPPNSRASSADGSYNTDGTFFEDVGEEAQERGRSKSHDGPLESMRDSGGNDAQKGNVLVSVRVRPDAAGGDGMSEGEWMVDGRRSLVSYKGREGGDYRYDNVFPPNSNNGQVYDSLAKRLVRRVMEGYHGTVFAYGMTGTGKTFSMQGTAHQPGVIPLAITDIFSYIRENPTREFLLRVSYLEIYNEKIYDLLSGGGESKEDIKLREDSKRGVYASPLKEEIVQSPNQLLRVIARGDVARRTSSTQFNARSSRSHAVVQIVVESRERTPSLGTFYEKESRRNDRILPGGVLVSTLSLIDLAGSEKAADSKERRQEGSHINKSLLTLGTVIGRLSGDDEKEDGTANTDKEKEKSSKHLPYRDSKLTRLLQPALSGNSLVSILCTVQLSSAGTSAATTASHAGETLNTLKFASRAKNNIVSHAKRNESNAANAGDPGSRALLDRYRIEILELRQKLEEQNKAKDEAERAEEVEEDQRLVEEDRKLEEELERQDKIRHEEQMLEMQLARTALKERIGHLNRLILSSKSLGVNSGRGSSANVPLNGGSTASFGDYGRPVSVWSGRDRDSCSEGNRDSTGTLVVVPMLPSEAKFSRTLSTGSITPGYFPAPQASHLVEDDEEGDDSAGVDGEGNASLAQHVRALQADLADKNGYIATLEKRLLQARRSSHSRISMQLASRMGAHDEGGPEQMIREKDREIDDLRARLDDQMRMVTALRSAARKRDMLMEEKPKEASPEKRRPSLTNGTDVRRLSSRASSRSAKTNGHMSNPSNASRTSLGVVNFSKTPLSPVALLSPAVLEEPHALSEGDSRENEASRRRSVDEMTTLLDQMIQDKVESGQVVRGERGSLRLKRDTVIEESVEGAEEDEFEERLKTLPED